MKNIYNRMLLELKNKKLLLWAALLHDIGKGHPDKGHAGIGADIVDKILKAKGLKPEDIDTVSFLVRYHFYS